MSTLRPRECPGLSLADVRTCVEGLRLVPVDAGGVRVTGVTLDSRDVRPGDLYAALPGANVHGARFVADAVSAGAVAVLTDPVGQGIVAEQADAGGSVPIMVAADARAVLGEVAAAVYDHPSRSLVLLGVTGTNGKTTVAHLVEQGLRSLGRVTGLVGTIETSVAGSRMKSVRTTPESPDLHALFAVMRQEQVRACVMEVSSHALQLHRVDGVVYDVAAFTNLSQDHLDFHHTMEEYYQAKARLFTPQRARCGVVVVDDEWGRRLAADAEVPVVTLTSDPGTPADWHLLPADSAGRSSPDPGSHADWFRLRGRGRSLRLRAALPGRHNRTNTAVAALMLLTAGESVEVVQLAFSREMTVPGRMERVDLGAGAPLVYVDFAHTPQAVTETLAALRERGPQPLVAVLGAGGGRDPGKRADMGAAAARGADLVVVTDDNPRGEDPGAIRTAVRHGAQAVGDRVIEVAGRQAAISRALDLAGGEGGLVAVLGKGHEQGQEIAGRIEPFDDREAVRTGWAQLTAGGPGAGSGSSPTSPRSSSAPTSASSSSASPSPSSSSSSSASGSSTSASGGPR